MSEKNQGKISQIIGPVVDVIFEESKNNLPKIYDALEVIKENGEKLILECEQHIGENSWYHEATLKKCLSCDPSKTPNLVKYSNQLKRAHSQTSLKCISMIMLAFRLIYEANALIFSVFHALLERLFYFFL